MSPTVQTHMESGYNGGTGLEVQTYFERFFLGGGKFGPVSNHEQESIIIQEIFPMLLQKQINIKSFL